MMKASLNWSSEAAGPMGLARLPVMGMLAVLFVTASAAQEQNGSVKDTFERYHLLGIFAFDCSQPPSEDNWYFVHRLIDDKHVQRDMMIGPTTRSIVFVLDKASELKPNEVAVSGTRDGSPVNGIWHLAEDGFQEWESVRVGKKEIDQGKFVSTGSEMRRLHKCEGEQQSASLSFDENTDRVGHTFREFNLAAADPKLCQSGCIADTQCTAWVYRKPEGRTDGQPHCWLRNKITKVETGLTDNLTTSGSVRSDPEQQTVSLHSDDTRPVAQEQSGVVKALFEKHDLFGTFAWDCTKPPSQDNWYYVNRVLDSEHVQRDVMIGATTRAWFSIIDTASELNPNQIAFTLTRDNGQRTTGVWHVEQNRMLQWSAVTDGKQIISNGKLVANGKDMSWLNRCDSR